jgi:hypothetical protein
MIKPISSRLKIALRVVSIVFIASIAYSCEKDELPVPVHDPGGVITSSVKMESNYRYQLFFDLETNTIIQQNLKTAWDLGFETSETGSKIILNSAKYMKAANTQQANFTSINDTIGYNFNVDMPSGSLDSTAIGNWVASNVYIIDRGFNELGAHQGFSKIEFIAVTTTEFTIHFSNLDGTNDINMNISKDNNNNFTFLSLSGGIVSVEPPKEDWDISFTQYTHYYYNGQTTYLVTGCLGNRNKVEIAQVFNIDFTTITLSDINNYIFSDNINTIGYDWKAYSFSTGSYTIFSDKNYIIKSTEGKYYKLHFIDFYDSTGTKGTPTFEFQEL